MNSFRKIVVVSNIPDKFAEQEDTKLAGAIREYCPAQFELLRDISLNTIQEDCSYLFRCIYDESTGNVIKDMKPIYEYLHIHRIPYLTVYNGKGDQRGKGYLADLYQMQYPVVPTFTAAIGALEYPAYEYLLKPAVGGSGKGVRQVTKEGLRTTEVGTSFVIQPVLDIAYETSYLYIDNEFQYSLKTRNSRWDLVVYEPSTEEMALVRKCVAWNPIKGIQRVDCVWTTDGKQLLLELEDWCPFLSLFDSENTPREKFVHNLFASLKNFNYDSLTV